MALGMAFVIGFFAGLRSLTAPAVVAWAVWLGWMKLERPMEAIGSSVTVIILTVLAVAELVADKLPKTPNRTEPIGLIARIVTGGVCGACVAIAGRHPAAAGAVLGSVGGVVGCYVGFLVRTRTVKKLRVPDMYVVLAEDLIAVGGSLAVASAWWM